MPADNGFRLDDDERVDPSIPEGAQRHPEEPVAAFEAGPRTPPLEDGELLAQRENLQTEVVAGANEAEEIFQECEQYLSHEAVRECKEIGTVGKRPTRLRLRHMQARDAAKIPQVVGPNRIAQFQGAGSDEEIRQRQNDPLAGLFSANASDDLSRGFSYRMNGNGDLERVEKGATAVAELGRIGAVDPVTDFGNGHGAEHDGNFSNHLLDTLDSLIWPQIPALGGNQDTGVQN